ncbi:hypothetical protein ACVWW1_000252 [Bradyrhizobium sp. JR3.5]
MALEHGTHKFMTEVIWEAASFDGNVDNMFLSPGSPRK